MFFSYEGKSFGHVRIFDGNYVPDMIIFPVVLKRTKNNGRKTNNSYYDQRFPVIVLLIGHRNHEGRLAKGYKI